MSNFKPSFQISPAPASTNCVSGMMKNQGFHFHCQNTRHVVDVPNSCFPPSREDSDKASAALALSALAGSKRTHSPTCVTDSVLYPPLVTSTPSNHHSTIPSNIKMTQDESPALKSVYHFDHCGERKMDPTMMLSSTSRSATITPFDPCKRMKISVPTPPLPGARNRSGSAFLPTEARSVAQVNQRPLPLVHTSKSEGNSGQSTSSTCIEKENMPSFVSMMQGSIPSRMSSLYNNVKDHSCQGMMLQNDGNFDIPPNQQLLPDGTYKRKDKSLGVLCVNFMLRYDKMKALNPQSTPSVSIDEASAYLAVERRRIYDIINILESINIVSRKCKNTYNWHGMDGILDTFFALQKEGVRNFEQDAINTGFKGKMEEMGIDYRGEESSSKAQEGNEHKCNVSAMPTGLAMLLAGAEQVDQKAKKKTTRKKVDSASKEKSLGRLSQKFIQLFLIGNERVVLTDASDKILGETPVPVLPPGTTAAEILKAQNSANKIMKTKIRRLYDIANVLASIGLIVKLNFGNNMNIANKNRPSFNWAYPVSPMEIMEIGRAKKVDKSN